MLPITVSRNSYTSHHPLNYSGLPTQLKDTAASYQPYIEYRYRHRLLVVVDKAAICSLQVENVTAESHNHV